MKDTIFKKTEYYLYNFKIYMPKKTFYKVNEDEVYKFLLETDLDFAEVKKFDNK